MLKKCFILALSLAAFSFAQDAYAPAPSDEVQYEDVSAYTSGAPAPETPVVNINEVASSDPIFYVSLHPISMLFWWALLDIPTVALTIEGCIGPSFAIVTRPIFMYWSDERSYYNEKEEVALYDFGVTEGIRYYFGAHHMGLYIEPQFIFEHVGLDYTYSNDSEENYSVSGNLFGGGAVFGYKIVSGHFTMSSDIGYAYTKLSLSGKHDGRDSDDDAAEAVAVGGGLTGSFSVGFAF